MQAAFSFAVLCIIMFFYIRAGGLARLNGLLRGAENRAGPVVIRLRAYWYLISRVLNFAILARQYFAGFYFRDFNRQI